jgi:hypothetical protein
MEDKLGDSCEFSLRRNVTFAGRFLEVLSGLKLKRATTEYIVANNGSSKI